MEKFVMILIPALIAGGLLRVLLIPMKLGVKLALHALCGLLCLWILNSIARFTGILLPINPVTVLVAGIAGVPGILVIAALALLG